MYTHANCIGGSLVVERSGSMFRADQVVESPAESMSAVKYGLDEATSLANDTEYGLTSSIYTTSLMSAMHAIKELSFGDTYVNRENFEAMQGFHAGVRKSGIGGADGKHGVYEYTATHVAYVRT